jgi:hypothetical protein
MRIISRETRYLAAAGLLALLAACSTAPPRETETATRDSAQMRSAAADSPVAPDAEARDTASPALWRYRLTDGWLSNMEGYDPDDPTSDDKEYEVENRAECAGQATVRRCNGENCWTWTRTGVQCSGKGNPAHADWLHDGADSVTVCQRDGEWTVATDIPGRGACTPEVTTDARGEPTRITLSCGWACRDPKFACRGGADYELVRPAAIH